jgi:hypothetical protein
MDFPPAGVHPLPLASTTIPAIPGKSRKGSSGVPTVLVILEFPLAEDNEDETGDGREGLFDVKHDNPLSLPWRGKDPNYYSSGLTVIMDITGNS